MSKSITIEQFKEIYKAFRPQTQQTLITRHADEILFEEEVIFSQEEIADLRPNASTTQAQVLNNIFGIADKGLKCGDIVKLIAFPENKDYWICTNVNTNSGEVGFPIGSYFVVMSKTKTTYQGGIMHTLGTIEGNRLGGLPDEYMEKVALFIPNDK